MKVNVMLCRFALIAAVELILFAVTSATAVQAQ